MFATLALLGLATVLTQVAWLHFVLRTLGGLYLVYLGVRIWWGASKPTGAPIMSGVRQSSSARSLTLGFITQISNPKAAVVYASIFAALLPTSVSNWMLIALPPLVFLTEASWYAVVALLFSSQAPQAIYLRARCWIDRTAGAVMAALGVHLLSEVAFEQR